MDPKAIFLLSMIALAATQPGAMAQGTPHAARRTPPAAGVAAPPVSPMAPQDVPPDSELGRYNDTYDGLESFWGAI